MITACVFAVCVSVNNMSSIDIEKVTEKDFGFLSGSWEAEIWGGVFEETWSVPRAGTLTHMGRHTSDGTTGFLEFASIEKKDGRWTLFVMLGKPSSGDKKPTPFVLEKATKGDFTFFSPTNAYPTRIRYQGEGKDTMTATLYGKEDGKDKTDVFNFKKVKQPSQ